MSKTMNNQVRVSAASALALLLTFTTAAASDASAEVARHLGVASCAASLCHGSAKPGDVYAVAQNEYVTWSHFDPHARAYRALTEERGAAIARRLGLPNAYEARVCLDCHADNVAPAARGPRFQLSDGVGCESCHGASVSWIATHDDAPAATHADSLARGLRALEQPRVRAEVCLDCHVGSDAQFATHRMMAAGHPRLAFELETFTELWRTSGGREHYRVDADYLARKGVGKDGVRKEIVAPSAVWSAGLFATVGRKLELLNGPRFNRSSLLPEFALFNCYSCHQSMRLKRWQDKGAGESQPGSLKFDDGGLRMLEAFLGAARPGGSADELRERMHAWQQAAGGDRERIAAATTDLRRFVSEQQLKLGGRGLNATEAHAALRHIAAAAARGDYSDYASAEQAAMGIVLLLVQTGGSSVREPAVNDLFLALTDDDQYDPARFREVLRRLDPRGSTSH